MLGIFIRKIGPFVEDFLSSRPSEAAYANLDALVNTLRLHYRLDYYAIADLFIEHCEGIADLPDFETLMQELGD